MLLLYLLWYLFQRHVSTTSKAEASLQAVTVAWPLLAAAIVHVLPLPSEIAKVSILLAAVPSGFFGILFAETYQVRSHGMGSTVIASTVFSILTLAITIGILFPQ